MKNYLKVLKSKKFEWLLLIAAVATYFGVFTTIALHRYWQYSVWYYDFGIFYSAISSVAQLKAPIIDHFIFTDQNILGDHFHPIIFLISPFLAIFKNGEVLLIFQSLFIALSGIFVYLTAKEVLKNKLESFSILAIYFSFLGLHNALITEFHEIVLLPLPLMIFLYGMVKKQKWPYLLGLIGVLLTKETTFIIPAWFGLLIAVKNTGLWRKVGIMTAVGSIAYGVSVIFLIIPAINGDKYFYLSEAVSSTNKIDFLTSFKIQTIIKTLLSFGFLPILSPESLGPVLINWWSRFSRFQRVDLGMHHNAEIAPTLIFATIYGWQRTKLYLKKFSYGIFFLAIGTFFLSAYIYKSPLLLFTNKAFYQHTQNFKFLDRLIEHIPEDGVVMAQTNIAAKIAYRKVYMLRDNYQDFNPDYIVVDLREGQEPNNFLNIQDFDKLIENLRDDPNYEIYYDQGEQLIYKRMIE